MDFILISDYGVHAKCTTTGLLFGHPLFGYSTSKGLEVNYLLVLFCLPFYLTLSLWVLLTNTRRNLTLFHFHTFWLLSNFTTFQLHLIILSLQVACCNNKWSILFIAVIFTMLFIYEYNLNLIYFLKYQIADVKIKIAFKLYLHNAL